MTGCVVSTGVPRNPMHRSSLVVRAAAGLAGVAVLFCGASGAWARRTGIAAQGCDGCHGGGQTPTVSLSVTPSAPMAAQPVTVAVSVSQTNGPVAGFYLTTAESNGTFQAIEPGTALNGAGVTHTMPRVASGGVTTFRAQWSPGASTSVQFLAYAVSANNNGAPTGDGAGSAQLSLAIGCAGITLYLDQDADGYGTADPAYPTREDCGPRTGYATVSGDCDDFNPLVHPDAPEMCDGKDNNCNGIIDEGARPACGVGWCRRNAATCDSTCTPGPPRPEQCNLFDDDCDGVIDNGTDAELCAASGMACVRGICVPQGSGSASGGASGSADAGIVPPTIDGGGGSGGNAGVDARTSTAQGAGAGGTNGPGATIGGCIVSGGGPRRSSGSAIAVVALIASFLISHRRR